MKKIFLTIICAIVSVSLLSACGAKEPVKSQTQGIAQNQNAQAPNGGAQKPDTDNLIGEKKAKEIALERAGISGDDIIFDRVELDFDDGIWEYEVEFRQGKAEYDANIKADDGTIISFESDFDD